MQGEKRMGGFEGGESVALAHKPEDLSSMPRKAKIKS